MKNIIEESYRIFSKYRAVRPLDVCTHCCMSIEEEALVASLPVHEIPREVLGEYNDGASTAKTPAEEFKHFLPRYIELASEFNFPTHSTELTFRRLEPFNKDEWTTEELAFLELFALEYFIYCLSLYPLPQGEQIDGILIMFWRGGFDLERLLTYWATTNETTSTLHYKDLSLEGFKQFNHHKLANAFGEPAISEKLRRWADADLTKRNFAAGIEKIIMSDSVVTDENTLSELSLVYQIISSSSGL